jgi:hypothetical protein
MNWLTAFLGTFSIALGFMPRSSRRVTFERPFVIHSPTLGFLNFMGTAAETIMKEDRSAIGPLFASVEESTDNPPHCDVLMIYGDVANDGRMVGSSDNLREIIQKSTAQIVIVASQNDVKSYIAAGKRPGQGRANLVMTLKRKGSAFSNFFGQLFRKMFEGRSMPTAWVELAPQIPGAEQPDCPEMIFAAEVSHIIFR